MDFFACRVEVVAKVKKKFVVCPAVTILYCILYVVTDGPTMVLVNLYVRSFEKIDDVKMEFSVQITFR